MFEVGVSERTESTHIAEQSCTDIAAFRLKVCFWFRRQIESTKIPGRIGIWDI